MKTARMTVVLLAAVAVSVVLSVSYAADDRTIRRNNDAAERRLALVIGNSAYKSSPLKNPVNDARAIEKTLKSLGFTVWKHEDLSYQMMMKSVDDFGDELLKGGGVGLFYYAGHGIQYNGRNFLIPTDAEISRENEIQYKSVDGGLVLAKMENARNRLNIVILDACRDNPFARSFRSAAQGLAFMDAPTGTIIAYATSPGKTASDGSGSNGLYTSELIRQMKMPGQSITDMFMNVRKEVRGKSDGKQVPWESTSLEGNFYFADGGSIATEKPQIPAEPAKPEQATMNITADVSGAEVWVNGNRQGVLPRNFTISESGKYEVEVTAPGYKKYRTSKNIELGKEYEVAVHLEKEQVEAASAPVVKPPVQQKPSVSGAKYRLRSEPITASNLDFKSKFGLNGSREPLEYVENDFRGNGDETITDYATGLMWQKSGSEYMPYKDAKAYIEELNSKKFAGYSDWRLPTVDELKSLLTPKAMNGDLYIEPIFDKTQRYCWRSDQHASGGAWRVSFGYGSVYWSIDDNGYVRAVRSLQ